MSPGQFLAAYGAVVVIGLIRTGYHWDNYNWDAVGPFPCLAPFIWPLTLPVLIGQIVREHAKRKRLAAEEKRKWLEAPLP